MHAYFPILKYCLQNLVKSEATEHKQDKLFLDPKQVNYRSLKKKQNLGINFILVSLTLMGWGGYFTFAVLHIHYRNVSCSYSTPLRECKTYRDHVLLHHQNWIVGFSAHTRR